MTIYSRVCLLARSMIICEGSWTDADDYDNKETYEKWKEEDIKTIFDCLFGEGGYLSYFENKESYLGSSEDEPGKNLESFLRAKLPLEMVGKSEFLGNKIQRKMLNLECLLNLVTSRCGTAANFLVSSFKHHGLEKKHIKALVDAGAIKEGEWAFVGYYNARWEFIFTDFIDELENSITFDVKHQAK